MNSHSPELASKSLLGTYFQFLRSPSLTAPSEVLPKSKARNHILRLYSLHFLLLLIVLSVIFPVLKALGLENSSLMENEFENIPAVFLFLMVVVAAPLIEESIFRLPLRAFALNVLLSSSLVAILLASFLTSFVEALSSWVPVLLLMLIGLNLYLWLKRPRLMVFRQFYDQHPRVIFYGLTLLFSALHITNYSLKAWPLLPLLVLPQTIIGMLLGFVRLRYGFRWGIFTHGFHNGCLMSPFILSKILGAGQAQGVSPESIKTLPLSDQLLNGALGLYMLGGIALCGVVAWKTLREWAEHR